MDDCSARMLRVLVAYYWLAICYPFSFFYFLVRYNMLWEGTACGLFFTVCFYPVYPFAALFLLLAKKALLPERAYEKVTAAPAPRAPSSPYPLGRRPGAQGTAPPAPALHPPQQPHRHRGTSSSIRRRARLARRCGTGTRPSRRPWRSSSSTAATAPPSRTRGGTTSRTRRRRGHTQPRPSALAVSCASASARRHLSASLSAACNPAARAGLLACPPRARGGTCAALPRPVGRKGAGRVRRRVDGHAGQGGRGYQGPRRVERHRRRLPAERRRPRHDRRSRGGLPTPPPHPTPHPAHPHAHTRSSRALSSVCRPHEALLTALWLAPRRWRSFSPRSRRTSTRAR